MAGLSTDDKFLFTVSALMGAGLTSFSVSMVSEVLGYSGPSGSLVGALAGAVCPPLYFAMALPTEKPILNIKYKVKKAPRLCHLEVLAKTDTILVQIRGLPHSRQDKLTTFFRVQDTHYKRASAHLLDRRLIPAYQRAAYWSIDEEYDTINLRICRRRNECFSQIEFTHIISGIMAIGQDYIGSVYIDTAPAFKPIKGVYQCIGRPMNVSFTQSYLKGIENFLKDSHVLAIDLTAPMPTSSGSAQVASERTSLPMFRIHGTTTESTPAPGYRY